MDGDKIGNFGKDGNQRIPKSSMGGKTVAKNNFASQAAKGLQSTVVRETQCLQQLRTRIDVSSVLMTSLARSCRGLQFANFGHNN